MYTITQTWGYTCRICDKVASAIIGFFNSFQKSIIVSRQIETNIKLARLMRHEYPGLTEAQILNELNVKTVRRMYDE